MLATGGSSTPVSLQARIHASGPTQHPVIRRRTVRTVHVHSGRTGKRSFPALLHLGKNTWQRKCLRSELRPVGNRAVDGRSRCLGPHPQGFCDSRPDQSAGRNPDRLVRSPRRLHTTHHHARFALPVSCGRRAGKAQHADRTGAAAVHRIGLQSTSLFKCQGGWHVAVHSFDRP